MKFSSTLTSKYLKASDLDGQPKRMTIASSELESVSRDPTEDPKVVVYFKGEKRGLVLNQVNGNTIGALYGDETDNWPGKEIVLYPTVVDFQGKQVPAIRLRAPKPKMQPPPAASSDGGEDDDDAIGF